MKKITSNFLVCACLSTLFFACQKSEVDSTEEVIETTGKPTKSDEGARLDFPPNIIAAEWAWDNTNSQELFFYWTTQGYARHSTTHTDTDPPGTSTYSFTPAAGKIPSMIAEIAKWAPLNQVNKHYAYYFDGTMSIGVSNDLDFYGPAVSYTCAPGKSRSNIVGIAFKNSGEACAWYNDGTRSSGTSTNLGANLASASYSLPPGKSYTDIIGMGIDRTNPDKVYSWFSDGTVSVGTLDDLDFHSAPVPFD